MPSADDFMAAMGRPLVRNATPPAIEADAVRNAVEPAKPARRRRVAQPAPLRPAPPHVVLHDGKPAVSVALVGDLARGRRFVLDILAWDRVVIVSWRRMGRHRARWAGRAGLRHVGPHQGSRDCPAGDRACRIGPVARTGRTRAGGLLSERGHFGPHSAEPGRRGSPGALGCPPGKSRPTGGGRRLTKPAHTFAAPDFSNPLEFWTAAYAAGREHDALVALEDVAGRCDPEAADGARVLLSTGLLAMGRSDDAAGHAANLAAAHPEDAGAAVALAGCLLTAGRWDEAWPLFERRLERPAWRTSRLQETSRWRGGGAPAALTLVCEDGDGDAIMLARYAAPLARSGCRVTFAAAARLLPLLERVEGVAAVVDVEGPLDAAEPWAPVLSLPGLLGTTPATVPSSGGYLTVDARRAGLWAHAGLPDGFRVGLCWASSHRHATPWWRSVPIEALAPLLKLPGIGWVNLQVGPLNGQGDAAGIACNPARSLRHYGQTAELVSQLDLVVTVDTSVAHLAGALGVPVLIMLPAPCCWRWLDGREDSPWYSSARLFRQESAGDWAGVVGAIGRTCGGALSRATRPLGVSGDFVGWSPGR